MIRKLFHYLAVYSNGLLILLIVLSFLGLISITSQAHRETISKIIQFNAFLIEDAPEPLACFRIRMGEDFGSKAGAWFMNDIAGGPSSSPPCSRHSSCAPSGACPTITPKDR